MDKKIMMKRLAEEIRCNSQFKESLEYFALAINTPEKSEAAVKCLRGIITNDEFSQPVFIALTKFEEQLGVSDEATWKCNLRKALVDLCFHLGSPDNCRIALCAIHRTMRGSFDLILERDAGTVDYCFMWAVRRCVEKIIDALAAAKSQSVTEDKEVAR